MSSLLWLRAVHASQSEASSCVERSLHLCILDFIGADVDVIDADVIDVDVDLDVIDVDVDVIDVDADVDVIDVDADVDADVDVIVIDIDADVVEFRLLEVKTGRLLQGVITTECNVDVTDSDVDVTDTYFDDI